MKNRVRYLEQALARSALKAKRERDESQRLVEEAKREEEEKR